MRPGIARSVGAFAAAGIRLTHCRTSEEVFNEIAFTDPFGHAVAVLEARTYSPVARSASETSLCGDFAELSLPVTDFGAAQAFWEPLGFVAAEEPEGPYPRLSLTSDNIDLAFHRPRMCERPMIVFRDAGMRARLARLRDLGVTTYAAPVPAHAGRGQRLAREPRWHAAAAARRRHGIIPHPPEQSSKGLRMGRDLRLSLSCCCSRHPPSVMAACGPFTTFPRQLLKREYDVDISPAWLDRVRTATIRLSNCTASFVSANGLILTNHHCAEACLDDHSTAERNLIRDGFLARSRAEELKCGTQIADVLMEARGRHGESERRTHRAR